MVYVCNETTPRASTMGIKCDMYWWNEHKKGTKCTISLHCFNEQGKIILGYTQHFNLTKPSLKIKLDYKDQTIH